MTYPNVYATQTGPLALSSLDANFLYAVDIANGALSATAGGTADALTATYSPAPAALVAGLTLYLRAASANATTTPQFSPNGLTGKVIVKNNNQALAVGDIAGAGHWLHLVYDATNGVWELINPATSASVVLTGGTANGVAYLNASKVLTTGTALTFDGTNFATTGTATATKLIPTGTSVTGNGLYLPAANALGLSTNGTNAVYIDSSQNVGIGTSSPATKLHLLTPSATAVALRTGNSISYAEFQVDASGNSQLIAPGGVQIFNTNGSERMRIDSSGNVGIGTTSPSGKLDVRGDVYLGSPSSGTGTYNRSTTNWNYSSLVSTRNSSNASTTKGLEFLYDGDAIGNTTIGGTNAIWSFANASPTTGSTTSGLQSGLTYGAYFGHRWNVNGTEVMRISDNYTAMFNTSTQLIRAGESFRVNALTGLAAFLTSTASYPVIALKNSGTNGYMMAFNNASGEIGTISSSGSNVAYNTSSDYRLKNTIAPMTGALAKVQALKPVTFKWNADNSHGEGFIAHELAEVVPDCVTGEKDGTRIEQYEISPAVEATFDEDGNELTAAVEAVMGEREVPKYQGIDTSFLVATLTAAIQELKALTDTQASTITALTARITALENK